MYSLTSIVPRYSAPFHDLQTMSESGFQFLLPEGALSEALESLKQSDITDAKILSTVSPKPTMTFLEYVHWIRNESDSTPSKQRKFFIEENEKVIWSNCRHFATSVEIWINPERKLHFPNDFLYTFGSFVVTKRLPAIRKKLDNSLLWLHNTGNVQTLKSKFFPQRSYSDVVRRQCAKKDSARIYIPQYGAYETTFQENVSVFIFWSAGLAAAMVWFGIEKCFGSEATNVPSYGTKRKLVDRREFLDRVSKFILLSGNEDAVGNFEQMFDVYFS